MKTSKKSITKLLLLAAVSVNPFSLAIAQDDGAVVATSVFTEDFDWVRNPRGGNDNIWNKSGISDDLLKDQSDSRGIAFDFTNAHPGNLCICIGDTFRTSSGKVIISKIPFDGIGFYTVRLGLYAKTRKDTNLISSAVKFTIGNSDVKANFYQGKFDYLKLTNQLTFKGAEEITIATNVGGCPVFIDQIELYKKNTVDSKVAQTARHIILLGKFTKDDRIALDAQLKANEDVTVVDVLGATFEEGLVELATGNPNCLFYDSSTPKLSNTVNCVRSRKCEKLVLKDGYPFDNIKAFTAQDVSYDRTFTPGRWSTLCVPFTVSAENLPGVSAINSLTGYDRVTGQLTFSTTSSIISSKPRIIKTTVAQPFIDLRDINAEVKGATPWMKILEDGELFYAGTYSKRDDLNATANTYIYGLTDDEFKLSGAGSVFAPFRCYLRVASSVLPDNSVPQQLATYLEGQPTDIKTPTSVSSTVTVYSITGVRVRSNVNRNDALQGLPKGVYIIDNKKYTVN